MVNENDEPLVPITLIVGKKHKRYEAVLDTGFNGYLSVPQSIADQSQWYFAGHEEYEIATGDVVREKVYLGGVIFDWKQFTTHIVTSHAQDILIGTKLLADKKLRIDFKKKTLWLTKTL